MSEAPTASKHQASGEETLAIETAARDPSTRLASDNAPSANPATLSDAWGCEYCGQSFSRHCDLNRHRKKHTRPYKCLDPSCAMRQIAFADRKDLTRHQSKHNGRRFYCPHTDCGNSLGGALGGFSRKDNLKRHVTTKHRWGAYLQQHLAGSPSLISEEGKNWITLE